MLHKKPIDLSRYPTIYLPSVYDPEKLHRGIVEIINMVQEQEERERQYGQADA